MRQYFPPVDVDLVLDDDVLAEDADVLHAHPLSHVAVPADDARLEPRVRLDPRALQHGAALDAHAVLHDHVGAQRHVGADAAVGPYLHGRVLRMNNSHLTNVYVGESHVTLKHLALLLCAVLA